MRNVPRPARPVGRACRVTPLAGAVLVGGASRRMGRPKALIEVDGAPMVVRVATALGAAGCTPVRLIGATRCRRTSGITLVEDRWPGEGPLGGVITALLDAVATSSSPRAISPTSTRTPSERSAMRPEQTVPTRWLRGRTGSSRRSRALEPPRPRAAHGDLRERRTGAPRGPRSISTSWRCPSSPPRCATSTHLVTWVRTRRVDSVATWRSARSASTTSPSSWRPGRG